MAHEQGKTFHYAWLPLSIVLEEWELQESQFPMITQDLLEAAKDASLWVTMDAQRMRDIKIFWVLMEINIKMGINCKSRLSPTLYNSV